MARSKGETEVIISERYVPRTGGGRKVLRLMEDVMEAGVETEANE